MLYSFSSYGFLCNGTRFEYIASPCVVHRFRIVYMSIVKIRQCYTRYVVPSKKIFFFFIVALTIPTLQYRT